MGKYKQKIKKNWLHPSSDKQLKQTFMQNCTRIKINYGTKIIFFLFDKQMTFILLKRESTSHNDTQFQI